MDYRSLRQQIENYCGNSDDGFIYSINDFIRKGEDKIGMLVDLPAYTKTATVTMLANTPLLDLSSITGFISVNDLFVSGYGIVEQKDTSFIREAYPDLTEKGPPRLFAMQNDKTLLLGPTPDINYSADLEYFGKWPSLVDLGTSTAMGADQNAQTFISSKFGPALFNAAMVQANLYMKDSEGVTLFKTELMESLGLVTKFAKGKAKADKAESTNAANDAGDQS